MEVLATYGSIVSFKNYNDKWIIKSVIKYDDNSIEVFKLPDFDRRGNNAALVVSYQNNNHPIINIKASSIKLDSVDEIDIIDYYDAIKRELLFYNQFPDLNDRVVCLYSNAMGHNIKDAINISKISGQTVLLQYCSNNDQRTYIPVVKEDDYFDVMIRWKLYVRQLTF